MTTPERALVAYERHMRTAKYSPATIRARLELLTRLSRYLEPDATLTSATPDQLMRFQESIGHLSRASVEIYSRHVRALYRWLVNSGQLEADPTSRMVKLRKPPGMPHPISDDDLKTIIACAMGGLRTAYVLAAFAGLRCGEICRLQVADVQLRAGTQTTALIHGKGGVERIVPLLPPVVDELNHLGRVRGPYVLTRRGQPFTPPQLSSESSTHMSRLGVESSLHGCRHYFATQVVRHTRDVLLVRDLLGHASLQTTQIYMHSTINDADARLAELAGTASLVLSR